MNQKTSARRPTTEVIRTHAERMAHEAEERLQKRRLILAEQSSSENPPDARIRAWERAHALCLPSDREHPVLSAIAICTGLTIAQIQEVQYARRAPRTASQNTSGQATSVDRLAKGSLATDSRNPDSLATLPSTIP
jgi:hypothetical protein